MGFLDNTGLTLVLNKIMAIVGKKQDTLDFDDMPTAGSSNPVKSGGVYTAIANISTGGGGGVAVQSDYEENDSFNAAYIKNRPFYDKSLSSHFSGYDTPNPISFDLFLP